MAVHHVDVCFLLLLGVCRLSHHHVFIYPAGESRTGIYLSTLRLHFWLNVGYQVGSYKALKFVKYIMRKLRTIDISANTRGIHSRLWPRPSFAGPSQQIWSRFVCERNNNCCKLDIPWITLFSSNIEIKARLQMLPLHGRGPPHNPKIYGLVRMHQLISNHRFWNTFWTSYS